MIPYIDIHTHVKVSKDIIAIYNLNSNEKMDMKNCSYGIHPWDLEKDIVEAQFELLQNFCKSRSIIAVGEIGLDRTINTSLKKQLTVFNRQILLAEKCNIPVIIHSVRAWSDLLAVRKKSDNKLSWIFHGFNSNKQIAEKLIEKGCYLSFGHQLLSNKKIQDTFITIPLEYLFLETDSSGEKIENIFKKAAELRHICIDDLKKQIYKNFIAVFIKDAR